MKKNIVLIGPLGVGKTTTGKQIAKKLCLVFYDTDHEIEKRSGVSIATIFEFEGEEGYRKRERTIIANLIGLDNIVLSSGGGAILSPENRALFSKYCTVIYLRASLETQLNRTNRRKGTRPMLNIDDPFQKIAEFDRVRAPLYVSIADYTFDTDKFSPSEIADQVAQLFNR
ncbi:MAG: hypothetical protein ACD_42C00601G0002 [uncultured bacterium]|nr:MAG: hypothetical protein ACD_42C00601G0002 [uncultured bacterium]OGT25617.1 MAG: hypothetical protein A3B71_06200 [Gammaproteobacteria bacterium RIFCSPHIGHO2_02_FULL_42_43]OGT27868.1 MAG: hypothetical protein A2624_07055 [Gammaproteobacteria bacterium RIFCSPHIGHO2_01_FULL_42_8]OGT51572.1 MAG: hypothetical protein A3E54_05965 [Gammaproteobacteria bacterium RIFCSPHIGHO2_12_FULL_41_25]OGT62271.1 MAG: hypothetical protein A3I77_04900 [Gammaproteobacteria bacterium RIFCSPLOWO2_02_FULL_42_14]OGT